MDRPSAKYEIIHSIVSQKDNLQNVKELCNIAGVSRSGYYNWLASEDKRLEREAKDKHARSAKQIPIAGWQKL